MMILSPYYLLHNVDSDEDQKSWQILSSQVAWMLIAKAVVRYQLDQCADSAKFQGVEAHLSRPIYSFLQKKYQKETLLFILFAFVPSLVVR